MASGNAQIEAAPGAARQRRGDQPVGIVRQRRIGVQEEERIAGTERGARVQRRAASARGGDDPVGERSRQIGRAVAGAAVDDDDLGAARAQRRKRLQRRNDNRRFIEHWNDDGEPTHGLGPQERIASSCKRTLVNRI